MVDKNEQKIKELAKSANKLRDINKAISDYLENNFQSLSPHNEYHMSIVVTMNNISRDIIDELIKLVDDKI